MLALIKPAFHAGEQLHDKRSLHLAAAECACHTGALLAVIWPRRTDAVQLGVVSTLFPTAFVVFPAVHNFLPHSSSENNFIFSPLQFAHAKNMPDFQENANFFCIILI